jgi:UDP-N-acetylmuramate--alanine ligase
MNFNKINTIYFIGIGGIGMSALARYFNNRGVKVHGYDKTETDLTKKLVEEGCKIHYEDNINYIPENVDLAVWTPAIPKEMTELLEIQKRQIPLKKRAEVLGIISRGQRCVAVGGTHGKTTTSSMAAHLFRACGVDATAFLGGIAANLGSNFAQGSTDWVVVEADEYDRSFLQLSPEIAVINSVDADHLDIYGSAEAVIESYAQFALQVKTGGVLLYKADQPLPRPTTEGVQIFTFGYEMGDFRASNSRIENGWSVFDLKLPKQFGVPIKNLKLAYPGKHNIENATAAIACALFAGIDKKKIRPALAKFKGVKRRFETILKPKKGENGSILIDDYGHHPAELEATIAAARQLFPDKKLTGIFQPHLFSRTRDFVDDFARALEKLDTVILLPIYPARELPMKNVNSEWILSKIKNVSKFSTTKTKVFHTLVGNNVEVVLTLGAGDIDQLLPRLKRILKKTDL